MKNKNIIIAILILLILILVSISIYMGFNYKKEENEVPPSTEDEESIPTEDPGYPFDTNNVEYCDLCIIDEEGNLLNNSDNLKKQHTNEKFVINNMRINVDKNNPDMANISFEVKNISNLNYDNLDLIVNFLDEFGNSKNKIMIPVGKISSSETVTVKEKVLYRIIDSYDFSFEENTKEGY